MESQHGLFKCLVCERIWADEIPPYGDAWWPLCCGVLASLLEPLLRMLG